MKDGDAQTVNGTNLIYSTLIDGKKHLVKIWGINQLNIKIQKLL